MTALQAPSYAVTYYFNGTLLQAFSTYNQGTPFAGSFSYEYPQATNIFQGPMVAPVGNYIGSTATFSIGTEQVSLTNLGNYTNIAIYNNNSFSMFGHEDAFYISFGGSASLGGRPNFALELLLVDDNGNALNSLGLVGDSMRLNQFNTAILRIAVQGDWDSQTNMYRSLYIQNELTALAPEPSSLSLLVLGGVIVACRRRKKE